MCRSESRRPGPVARKTRRRSPAFSGVPASHEVVRHVTTPSTHLRRGKRCARCRCSGEPTRQQMGNYARGAEKIRQSRQLSRLSRHLKQSFKTSLHQVHRLAMRKMCLSSLFRLQLRSLASIPCLTLLVCSKSLRPVSPQHQPQPGDAGSFLCGQEISPASTTCSRNFPFLLSARSRDLGHGSKFSVRIFPALQRHNPKTNGR